MNDVHVESAPRVLVVDDHAKVAATLRRRLAQKGYVVRTVTSADDARAVFDAEPFDVLVLDVTRPGRDALQAIADFRGRGSGIRILVLAARGSLATRLVGSEAGADDYMVEPFAMPEVIARVGALLRRARERDIRRLRFADLELDLITRQVSRGGRAIDLAPREFELLAYLLSHAGRVVTREMLVRDLWPQLERDTPANNVIDVHAGRLRRKVDGDSTTALIHTIRGSGFRVSIERI